MEGNQEISASQEIDFCTMGMFIVGKHGFFFHYNFASKALSKLSRPWEIATQPSLSTCGPGLQNLQFEISFKCLSVILSKPRASSINLFSQFLPQIMTTSKSRRASLTARYFVSPFSTSRGALCCISTFLNSKDLRSVGHPVSLSNLSFNLHKIDKAQDEIHYLPPKPPVFDVLGGGGTYSALGARLLSPPPLSRTVSWIIDAGSDFPSSVFSQISAWDTSVLIRSDPSRLTTRGWNGYDSNQNRAFK
jgi:hypothetical protein